MRSVDPVRLRELLGNVNEALGRLRQLQAVPLADFLADFRNTESAKYLLVVACEATIDICNHIAARHGGSAPDEYAQCFAILADLQVIDRELAQRLQSMARFRNLLVHLYWKVDNERVYQVLATSLVGLDEYCHQIAQWAAGLPRGRE
jgi:uncharacterized protein YutE (UPF0331/DUF86 family)